MVVPVGLDAALAELVDPGKQFEYPKFTVSPSNSFIMNSRTFVFPYTGPASRTD